MELEHFCCLMIVLSYFLSESDEKENVVDPSYCNLSHLTEPFPIQKIPQNWLFQLSFSNSNKRFCIEESNQLIIRSCNFSKQSQFWFQYENSLINAESGRSLDVQNSQSFTFDEWNENVAKWNCTETNAERIKLKLNDVSSNTYFAAENTNAIKLNSNSKFFWTLFGKNGSTIHSNRLCQRRKGFCGPPKPGVNSYIVSNLNWHSDFYNVPSAALNKALKVGRKLCYSGGETIIYACLQGFHTPRTKNTSYEVSHCLGGGVWSLTKPTTCEKQMCDDPPNFSLATWHTEDETAYGVHAHYSCIKGYKGADENLICGPKGFWMGKRINCTRKCLHVLTQPNGTIKTPNYPGAYPNLAHCTWKLRAPKGIRIVLWIRDFFVEQGTVYPPYCRDDYVQFLETINGVERHSQRYCGSDHPRIWTSKTNAIDIEFESDFDIRTKGFQLQYIFWNDAKLSTPPEPYFDFNDPDFLDNTFVFYKMEAAHHILEIVYGLVVGILLSIIIFIIARHIYVSVAHKIYPDRFDLEILRAQAAQPRRNAISQHTESNLFDSMNKSSSLTVVNETSLLKSRSLAIIAKEIEEFREMTGQLDLNQSRLTNKYGISKTDIIPVTMLSDMALDKYYADKEYNRSWNQKIENAKTSSEANVFRRKMKQGMVHKQEDEIEIPFSRSAKPSIAYPQKSQNHEIPQLVVTRESVSPPRLIKKESDSSIYRFPEISTIFTSEDDCLIDPSSHSSENSNDFSNLL